MIFLILLLLPLIAGPYALNFFIHLFITVAYASSWNLMAGFCGQYSFGHAMYAGLSGYLSAWLFVNHGVSPILSLPLAVGVSALVGGSIAYLASIFNLRQGYFTLLSIATLECSRILFESWFCGGLFIPHKGHALNLRLSEIEFYYLFLCTCGLFIFLGFKIFTSKFGYSCRALNNNLIGASAIGINTTKMQTLMMMLSSALTGLVGVFSAYYDSSLFPEHVFSLQKSVGMIIPCLFGGIGTILGPVIGGVGLSVLNEALEHFLGFMSVDLPGIKHIIFGFILLISILKLPQGIYPYVRSKLKALPKGFRYLWYPFK